MDFIHSELGYRQGGEVVEITLGGVHRSCSVDTNNCVSLVCASALRPDLV